MFKPLLYWTTLTTKRENQTPSINSLAIYNENELFRNSYLTARKNEVTTTCLFYANYENIHLKI